MKHIVCIRAAYPPQYGDDANLRRLRLFRSICIPALAQQRDRGFELALLIHPADRMLAERKAAALLAYVPIHFVESWEELPTPSIQTRLDDDDALAVDFIGRLREACENRPAEWYTFPNGITAAARRCKKMKNIPNQFVSRRCESGQCVFDVKHGAVRDLHPVHVDEMPAWMWWRHGDSRSRSRSNGMKTPLRDYLHTFGCDWHAMGFLKHRPEADWSLSHEAQEAIRRHVTPGMATLEFGSGKSTDLFAELGTEHTALDHDRRFSHRSASLTPIVGGWYSWRPQRQYDFVLVDGPPECYGREMMAERVEECVGPGSIVLVDDTHREIERRQFVKLSEGRRHQAWSEEEKQFGIVFC